MAKDILSGLNQTEADILGYEDQVKVGQVNARTLIFSTTCLYFLASTFFIWLVPTGTFNLPYPQREVDRYPYLQWQKVFPERISSENTQTKGNKTLRAQWYI